MSVVTNLILVSSGMGSDDPFDAFLAEVNQLADSDRPADWVFVSVEDSALPLGWYGGTKFLEAEIAIAAVNHLNLRRLVENLRTVNFDKYQLSWVQLIVCGDEDCGFGIIEIWRNCGSPFNPSDYDKREVVTK